MAAIERAVGSSFPLLRIPSLDEVREKVVRAVMTVVDPPYPTPDGKPLEVRAYRREDLKPQTREALDALAREIIRLQTDSKEIKVLT